VLRRAIKASWCIWIGFLVYHVLCWGHAHELPIFVLVMCCAGLIATLRARSEKVLWGGVSIAMLWSYILDPVSFHAVALMAAVVLLLKGWRGLGVAPMLSESTTRAPDHPYRTSQPPPELEQEIPSPYSMRRPYVGAIFCSYLSLWTWGWHGIGYVLPEHNPIVALPVCAVLLFIALRSHMPSAFGVALALLVHVAAQRHVFSQPKSTFEWGALFLVAGFVLLVAGVGINWRMRNAFPTPPEPSCTDAPTFTD